MIKSQLVIAAVGFIVAPIAPAILFAMLTPIKGTMGLQSIYNLFLIGYFFSAAFILVYGIPAFALIRHFKLIRWWTTLIVGLIGGIIFGAVLRLPNQFHMQDVLLTSCMGVLAALTFWLIWKILSGDTTSAR